MSKVKNSTCGVSDIEFNQMKDIRVAKFPYNIDLIESLISKGLVRAVSATEFILTIAGYMVLTLR